MITETHIRLTAKMYEMRDTAKTFLRDSYSERMIEIGAIIKARAKREKCDELQSMIRLAKDAQAENESPFVILYLTAALVEMLEPSA